MKSIFHTRRFQGLLAFAWALTLGCSGGSGGGGDGGSGGPDQGIQDAAMGGVDGDTTVADLGVQSDLRDPNAPGLELLAGALGGSGDVDGVGATARVGAVGAAYDGAGNLYFADGHGSIRKLATATGAVTTLVQTPAFPYDLAWDGAGSLYVTVSYLNSAQILKVAVATGTATLLAGSANSEGYLDGTGPAARFTDLRGAALDRASGILYVADSGNNLIRKVVVSSGVVTTLAGATTAGSADGMGTAARFNKPWGLCYDGSASLYVADQDGTTIRKIDVASTLVSTISGAYMTKGYQDGNITTARFYAPTGLTLDGAGNLFITDGAAGTIRRLALATGQVTTFAGTYGTGTSVDGIGSAARLQSPQGIVWDGAADLYFSESYTVRKVTLATADVKTVAGATFHSGNTDGAGTTARFALPAGMVAADFGTLYLADRGNNRIRKIDLVTRQVTTFAGGAAGTGPLDGTGTAARFSQPQAVTWDGRGNLYVADTFGRVIRKIVIATAEVSTLAGTAMMAGTTDGTGAAARFTYPTGVAADGAGNVFVADSSSRQLRKIVVATGEVTTIGAAAGYPPLDGTGPAARFVGVEDVVSDRAGNVYIVDSRTIRKLVVATNEVTTLAGNPATVTVTDGIGPAAGFLAPHSITYDGVGNLFVAESSPGVALVRKLNLQTLAVTTVAGKSAHGVQLGALPGSLNQPRAVAVAPGFGLAISDELEHSILLAHGL